ncbi:MAG TPA: response regulator [Ktedonobacteraceae bacterium]|nr:response regulator [Ktedonobacteraceae bacterium]
MSSRILVIDDNQSILDLYCTLLESEGYEVSTSMVAYEQPADIEALHPDLIILDVKLNSQYDGFLLLQKLKLYRPTKDIPVILCTAAVQAMQEQEEILRQKHIPLIYKPFDLDELLQVVHQLLPPASAHEHD